jgi:hypothetical protein
LNPQPLSHRKTQLHSLIAILLKGSAGAFLQVRCMDGQEKRVTVQLAAVGSGCCRLWSVIICGRFLGDVFDLLYCGGWMVHCAIDSKPAASLNIVHWHHQKTGTGSM